MDVNVLDSLKGDNITKPNIMMCASLIVLHCQEDWTCRVVRSAYETVFCATFDNKEETE